MLADFMLGLAIYLEGDRQEGIDLIRKWVGRDGFVELNAGYLQFLYDAPGFPPFWSCK